MSGETYITVVGNLSADPELRFTPSGAAVANFTIASTPRAFDKAANEWKDQETLWMRCSIWRDAAEHVAESLRKGMRVVAYGRLIQRSWEDAKTGEKRSSVELQVEEVGPSLKYATAKVIKTERSGQDDAGRQAQAGEGNQDPWSTPASNAQAARSGWGN